MACHRLPTSQVATSWPPPAGGEPLERTSTDEQLAQLEKKRKIAQAEREIAQTQMEAAKARQDAMHMKQSEQQSAPQQPSPASTHHPGAVSAARAALGGAALLLSVPLAGGVPPGAQQPSGPVAPGTSRSPQEAWGARQQRLAAAVPISWAGTSQSGSNSAGATVAQALCDTSPSPPTASSPSDRQGGIRSCPGSNEARRR